MAQVTKQVKIDGEYKPLLVPDDATPQEILDAANSAYPPQTQAPSPVQGPSLFQRMVATGQRSAARNLTYAPVAAAEYFGELAAIPTWAAGQVLSPLTGPLSNIGYKAGQQLAATKFGKTIAPVAEIPSTISSGFFKLGQQLAATKFGKAIAPAMVGAAPDIEELAKGGVDVLTLAAAAKGLLKPGMFGPSEVENVTNQAIKQGVDKGIGPLKRGPTPQVYMAKAKTAITNIVKNKNNISLTDDVGNPLPPESVPQTADQFADAIRQMKTKTYNEYNTMSKQAGEIGVQHNITPTTDILRSISGDPLAEIEPNKAYTADVRQHAMDLSRELGELQGAPPEVIEQRIADLNQRIYKSKPNLIVKEIDKMAAQSMRQQLDLEITSALDKPGYQDLKNQYGALKQIEPDVNRRADMISRQAMKNLSQSVIGPLAAGDVARGVIKTMAGVPGAATDIIQGAVKKSAVDVIKKFNHPNRYIKNMFGTLSSIGTPAPGIPLPSALTGRPIYGAGLFGPNFNTVPYTRMQQNFNVVDTVIGSTDSLEANNKR